MIDRVVTVIPPPPRAVILCPDPGRLQELEAWLAGGPSGPWNIQRAGDPAQAATLAVEGGTALVCPPPGGELVAVEALRALAPGLPLVLVAEDDDLELATQALARGAQDCLAWPWLTAPSLLRSLALAPARLAALDAARQVARRYCSIVEEQTEMICRITPEGEITFGNPAYRLYFGIPADKVLGASIYGRMSPEDADSVRRCLAGLTPSHPLARNEHPYITPRGEKRWQKWTIVGLFDQDGTLHEVQCVGLDITERKLMEETLQVVESNLRQLIINNADGLIVASLEGVAMFVNPAAETMLGKVARDLVGCPFPYPLRPGERQELCLLPGQEQETVVEMRVVETKWQGQPAYLASLRDITELARLREELRALSLVDELTGLYNRRGFLTLGRQQIKTAHRMGRRLHLFYIDLDDLKIINDQLGHLEGDRALVAASRVLRATFRESDIVARVGGDEFAALAMESLDGVVEPVLARLIENQEAHNQRLGGSPRLSLSIGTAVYDPYAPRPLDALLSEADRRMYADKRAKNNSAS